MVLTSWLSCDRADADPARFWAGFIEAPRAIAPGYDPFIEQLISAALEVRASQDGAGQPGRVLVEALTDAEQRVLTLLPTSTYLQVAGILYVSRNTVKTHLRSIYRNSGRPRAHRPCSGQPTCGCSELPPVAHHGRGGPAGSGLSNPSTFVGPLYHKDVACRSWYRPWSRPISLSSSRGSVRPAPLRPRG